MPRQVKPKTVAKAQADLIKKLPRRHSNGKVGSRVQKARLDRGISQRELAFPGCSYAYLSRIEHNTRRPSLTVLVKLAILLDTSFAYLVSGQDDQRCLTDEEREQLFMILGVSSRQLPAIRKAVVELKAAYERGAKATILMAQAQQLMGKS
ncbi:MAG: hypothetical protein JWO96_831 [Candidatus Saccharibacteria bacterium]|nr:hypothetical protein [Candidatus Saccharibacteria bacterium]